MYHKRHDYLSRVLKPAAREEVIVAGSVKRSTRRDGEPLYNWFLTQPENQICR